MFLIIWIRLLSSINNFLFCAETKSRNTANNPPEVDVTVLTNGELKPRDLFSEFYGMGKLDVGPKGMSRKTSAKTAYVPRIILPSFVFPLTFSCNSHNNKQEKDAKKSGHP